ncbi:MAG: DUF4118 domain-containing protein [Vicinamibacterales bacterium]
MMPGQASRLAISLAAIALTSVAYSMLRVGNATTVSLSFLMIVLLTAATSALWVAVVASFASMLCVNYFFLPPVGTFSIADPQNWVALAVFLAVSLVASQLSTAVRAREQEALDRRDELGRLFDLSRDVLLMSGGPQAMTSLALVVARRFELDYVAVCLPSADGWSIAEAGRLPAGLDPASLTRTFSAISGQVEFDAASRSYGGHQTVRVGADAVHVVPLRAGAKAVGLLAASPAMEPGTYDALAGLVAIAVERAQFLEERKAAEVSRQGEALKSALLASLAHDLRTPLTAIRVAASNLQASWLTPEDRQEQSAIVLAQVDRLTRLFQNILDMARIDAGAIEAERRWVHPSEIVSAARDLVAQALAGHPLGVRVEDVLVKVDPRLTSAALSHLLENAAEYSPPGSAIEVAARVEDGRLTIEVLDRGPGIATDDLPRLFDRFYRGRTSGARPAGSGMGLSIARGLLAVEQGQVWADNRTDGGAVFTIAIPTTTKRALESEGP